MDRIQEYPGQTPIDVDDFLNQRVADMIALGELIGALLGTSTMVDGLACTPTSPASMDVVVAPGQIFMQAPVDTTTFGDLSPTIAINGHNALPNATNIMKQGIILESTTFPLTAPATAGYSVDFLIEATFEEVDANNTVLNYFTALNSPPLSGPNGNGTAQPTLRKGSCILQLKQGVAAPTGTQSTPAVDAGYVGLWVITVANGQATVTAPNIVAAPNAPFLSQNLQAFMTGLAPVTVADATPGTQDAIPISQADARYLAITALANYATLTDVSNDLAAYAPLSSFVSSFGGNGYFKFPNGLIIQWGSTPAFSTNSTYGQAFPITFPTSCLFAIACGYADAGNNINVSSWNASSVNITDGGGGSNGNYQALFLAIGH